MCMLLSLAAVLALPRATTTLARDYLEQSWMKIHEPSNSARMNCAELPVAEWRAACEIQNVPGKRERHLARMAQCRWRPEPMEIVQMSEGANKGPEPANQQMLSKPYVPCSSKAKRTTSPCPARPGGRIAYEACEVWDEESAQPGVWAFFRVGPLASYGGYTWSRLFALFHANGTIGRLTGTTGGGDAKVYIADHVAGNADEAGDLYPYPPIHQHHYHLVFGSNMWRQALNAHGDGECLDGQRHYCMLKEYPPGMAFHTTHRLGVRVPEAARRAAARASLPRVLPHAPTRSALSLSLSC